MQPRFQLKAVLYGFILLFLSGASPQSANYPEQNQPPIAQRALDAALAMIGKPYKYQGESPTGFDCSGLVRYSYLAAGMDVPHASAELRQISHPVAEQEMRKGDLVFFERDGKNYHVGIYAGDNRFIHAPRPGKFVRFDRLLDPYWKLRFIDARRL